MSDPWGTIFRHLFGTAETGRVVANKSNWKDLFQKFSVVRASLGPELANAMASLRFVNATWFPLVAGGRFGAKPSCAALAEQLAWLAEHWGPTLQFNADDLPWPLGRVSRECIDKR